MSEKTIAGLSEQEWKDRYVAYMMKHSDALEWQAREFADVSWDISEDEEPEECASEEMSLWE